MTVIILHPTDELKLINFQKEVIGSLYDEKRILYAAAPLWIELDDFEIAEKNQIKKIEIGDIEFSENEIYSRVLIECEKGNICSKLTLVNIYKGESFSQSDRMMISEKIQPVRQLKVFRLGLMQEQGPHTKSISKSVWCKLK